MRSAADYRAHAGAPARTGYRFNSVIAGGAGCGPIRQRHVERSAYDGLVSLPCAPADKPPAYRGFRHHLEVVSHAVCMYLSCVRREAPEGVLPSSVQDEKAPCR